MAYIGNTPVAGAFKKLDSISSSFNGSLLTFPLTVLGIAQSVGTPQNVIISISGIIQEPVTAFSISGSNIIFTGAPLATDTFFGIVLGNVGILNGPSDGTVTSSSFAANAITNSLGYTPYNQANTLNTPTGAAIASASSINLSTATGNIVHVTGTTTINTVVLASGFRTVVFDGILTLTYNALTNKLPGGLNITTAVGDIAYYEGDGTTVYCTNYVKASGNPVVAPITGINSSTNIVTTTTLTSVNLSYHTVAMSVLGLSVTLPDATTLTIGTPRALFKNTGGYPFGIRDNSGNLLMAVAVGGVAYLSLDGNSTIAGSWSITGTNLEPGLITIDNTFSNTYASSVFPQYMALDNNTSVHFASLSSNGFSAFIVDNAGKVIGIPVTVSTVINASPGAIFKISSTSVLITYNAGGPTYAVILSISGTSPSLVITVNTSVSLGGSYDNFISPPRICALLPNLYIGIYGASGTIYAQAISVSGNVLSVGTNYTVATSNASASWTIYPLTANTAYLNYCSSPGVSQNVILSASGTTITMGAIVAGGAGSSIDTGLASCILSPTKVFVSGDAGAIKVDDITISGTVISLTTYTVEAIAGGLLNYGSNNASRYSPHLFPLSTTSALLWYNNTTSNYSRVVVITDSNGSITAGNILYRSISSSDSPAYASYVLPQGIAEFAVLRADFTSGNSNPAYKNRFQAHKINGNVITVGGCVFVDDETTGTSAIQATGIRLPSGDYVLGPSSNSLQVSTGITVIRSNGDYVNKRGSIKYAGCGGASVPLGVVSSNRLVILTNTLNSGTLTSDNTAQLRLFNLEIAI